jgi:ADP-ribosylglycohydrolase
VQSAGLQESGRERLVGAAVGDAVGDAVGAAVGAAVKILAALGTAEVT